MSNVVLQVGGCGNRVGRAFFDLLARDAAAGDGGPEDLLLANHRCFVEQNGAIQANAVLLGTEKVVLNRRLGSSGRLWRYGDARFVASPALGDNFAAAFDEHSEDDLCTIVEVIRQMIEGHERLGSILALLSLAGGTGTGLGSRVVQEFKDQYPRSTIICAAVWPFASPSETPLQPYNTVLGLSYLQDSADAVLLLGNDNLLKIAEKRQRPRRPTLEDMNSAGAGQLACLLLPSQDMEGQEMSMGDVVRELKCGGLTKYLSIIHTPWVTTAYDSFTWRGLARSLRRTHQTAGRENQPLPCLAALTVARGKGVSSFDPSDIKLDDVQDQSTWRSDRRFLDDKTLLLVSNGHACLPQLSQAARNASRMCRRQAFLSHYLSNGVGEDDIRGAIESVGTTLRAYLASYPRETPTQACGDPPGNVNGRQPDPTGSCGPLP